MIKMNHGSIQIIRKEEQMKGLWIQNRLTQVEQTYSHKSKLQTYGSNGSDANSIEEAQSPFSSKSSNNQSNQQNLTSSRGNSFYQSCDDVIGQSKLQQFLESDNIVEKNNSVSSQRKRQFYAQTKNKNYNKTNFFQNNQNKNKKKNFNTIYSEEESEEQFKLNYSRDTINQEEEYESNQYNSPKNQRTLNTFGTSQESSLTPKHYLTPKNQNNTFQITKQNQLNTQQNETESCNFNFQETIQQKKYQETQQSFFSRQNSPKEVKIDQNGYYQDTFQNEETSIPEKNPGPSSINQTKHNLHTRNLFFYSPQVKQNQTSNINQPISSVVSLNDNINPYNSIHLSYLKKIHQGLLAKKDNLTQLQQYQICSTIGQNSSAIQITSPEKTYSKNSNSFHMLFLEIDKQKRQQTFKQNVKKNNPQNVTSKQNFQVNIRQQGLRSGKDLKILQSQLILNKFNQNVQTLRKQQEMSNQSLAQIQNKQQQQSQMFLTPNKLSQQNINNSIFINQNNQKKKTLQDLSNTSFSTNQQTTNFISIMRNYSQDCLVSYNKGSCQEYQNMKNQTPKQETQEKSIGSASCQRFNRSLQNNQANININTFNLAKTQNNYFYINKSSDINEFTTTNQIFQTNCTQNQNKTLNISINNNSEAKFNTSVALPQLDKKNQSQDRFKKSQAALSGLVSPMKDQSLFFLNNHYHYDKNHTSLNSKQLSTLNGNQETISDKPANSIFSTQQTIKDFGKYAKVFNLQKVFRSVQDKQLLSKLVEQQKEYFQIQQNNLTQICSTSTSKKSTAEEQNKITSLKEQSENTEEEEDDDFQIYQEQNLNKTLKNA